MSEAMQDCEQDQLIDITADLDVVIGGGKITTLWKGLKAVYRYTRPYLKETADVIKDVTVIGVGTAYGAGKLREIWRGKTEPQHAAPDQATE